MEKGSRTGELRSITVDNRVETELSARYRKIIYEVMICIYTTFLLKNMINASLTPGEQLERIKIRYHS